MTPPLYGSCGLSLHGDYIPDSRLSFHYEVIIRYRLGIKPFSIFRVHCFKSLPSAVQRIKPYSGEICGAGVLQMSPSVSVCRSVQLCVLEGLSGGVAWPHLSCGPMAIMPRCLQGDGLGGFLHCPICPHAPWPSCHTVCRRRGEAG